MKSYLILIIGILFNFFSQLFFDDLSNDVNFDFFTIENFIQFFSIILYNYKFWTAMILFCLGSLLWIIGLKKIPLSNAFSIASLNYILIFIYSSYTLNKDISLIKIVSCSFIVIGIIMFAKGLDYKRKKTLLTDTEYR